MHILILMIAIIILYWFLALVVLFLHELGHTLVAMFLNVPVKGIGLAWKGAYILRSEGTPKENILISFAGPLINILIGIAILLLSTNKYLGYFALMNFINAGANLLPIKGSDGDRILTCWQMIHKEKLHVPSSTT